LNFSTILARMQDRYDLELVGDERLPAGGDILWQHIRGKRRDGDGRLPGRVDLWTDPETGVLGGEIQSPSPRPADPRRGYPGVPRIGPG
jgi:hypothetical protein